MLRRLFGGAPDEPGKPLGGGTPVADVEAALAYLESGGDQFAVFEIWRGRYVQVTISESGLYGEAVANAYLKGDGRIDDSAIRTLADLGWSTRADPNYSRTWPDWKGDHRARVVDDIVETLMRVYGMPADGVIDVTTDT